jgi:hypothetical protein
MAMPEVLHSAKRFAGWPALIGAGLGAILAALAAVGGTDYVTECAHTLGCNTSDRVFEIAKKALESLGGALIGGIIGGGVSLVLLALGVSRETLGFDE